MSKQRVVVISACTGRKLQSTQGGAVPAERLYTGDQHRRLMAGVDALRRASTASNTTPEVELWIVSAKHGVVRGNERITPYDRTFSGLDQAELVAQAERLEIPSNVARILQRPFSLGVLLLGNDYVQAAALQGLASVGGPTLAFCSQSASMGLGDVENLRAVPLGPPETRRFNCGLVGLKGELGRRLLTNLAHHRGELARAQDLDDDLLARLDDAQTLSMPLAA